MAAAPPSAEGTVQPGAASPAPHGAGPEETWAQGPPQSSSSALWRRWSLPGLLQMTLPARLSPDWSCPTLKQNPRPSPSPHSPPLFPPSPTVCLPRVSIREPRLEALEGFVSLEGESPTEPFVLRSQSLPGWPETCEQGRAGAQGGEQPDAKGEEPVSENAMKFER